MNKYLIRIMTVACLAGLIGFSACEPTEETPEEIFMKQLAGNWTATEVMLDDIVIENAFEGFQLSITADKKFTTQEGNDPIWPASGSFTLKGTNATPAFDLVRNDGVEIEVSQLDDNNLMVEFHYISTGGRAKSVTGDYEFTLTK